MRSSVESRASTRGSRATNLATNSSARDATGPGQCSAADNRRFANAAARQGGTDARGASTRCSARNRRSLVDGITADAVFAATITAAVLAEAVAAAVAPRCEDEDDAALLQLAGAASNSGAKLSDWIRTYNCVVKSVRSTLSASPELEVKKKGLEGLRRRAGRAVPFDWVPACATHLVRRGVHMP